MIQDVVARSRSSEPAARRMWISGLSRLRRNLFTVAAGVALRSEIADVLMIVAVRIEERVTR